MLQRPYCRTARKSRQCVLKDFPIRKYQIQKKKIIKQQINRSNANSVRQLTRRLSVRVIEKSSFIGYLQLDYLPKRMLPLTLLRMILQRKIVTHFPGSTRPHQQRRRQEKIALSIGTSLYQFSLMPLAFGLNLLTLSSYGNSITRPNVGNMLLDDVVTVKNLP